MIRVHTLDRFHIGGGAYFVWAPPPNAESTTQRHGQLHSHTTFNHNIKATFVAVIEGLGPGGGPPSSRLGRPKQLRQEACMDSTVM